MQKQHAHPLAVPERRMTLPLRTRPVTSYMPSSEALPDLDRRVNRRSFHLTQTHAAFDWLPYESHGTTHSSPIEDPMYNDPFSDATFSPLPTQTALRGRRHSSLAQSFKSGFQAMTRRMSLTLRGSKGKGKDEQASTSKVQAVLRKRRSLLWDVAETPSGRPKTRGFLNSLAGRRRPSMPLMDYHEAPQTQTTRPRLKISCDSAVDTHRMALLSPYVSGGAGARAAAAAQNEAMMQMRETPLPTYDAAVCAGSELRDSESGIGISIDENMEKCSTSRVARCDPIDYLANELVEQILSYLDLDSLLNAERVCKRWAQLTKSQLIWRELLYRDYAGSRPPRIASTPTSAGLGKNVRGQDHRKLYAVRRAIDSHWREGKAAAIYLNGHKDSVYCIQFDEDKIITGSRDNTIRVWDSRTYQCIKKLGPPVNPRERNNHQRNEPAPSGVVPFFKSETSSPDPPTVNHNIWHEASVLSLQYDDNILVTGSSDFTCIVWSIKNNYQPMFRLLGHTAGVLDVCIGDTEIVTCSKDTTIKVWDKFTGRLLKTLVGHRGPVNAVQIRGKLLASASGDGMSKLWRLEDGLCIKEFHSKERGLACVEFSEDGRTILAGGNDHLIYEYNTVTGNIERELQGHTDLVRSLHFDSANNRIISGSYDQSIKIWDAKHGCDRADGGLKLSLDHWTSSWMLAVKSNYRKIACASQDGRVVIIDFGYGIEGVHLVEG